MKKSILMFFISLSFCFSQGQITDTIFHRVKKNETLYSISNQYSVDISDIISLNPDLKDNRLKRRSRIMIPVFSEVISADIVISDLVKKVIRQYTKLQLAKKPEVNVHIIRL